MTTHSLGLLSNGASGVGRHWLSSAVEMAAAEPGNWPLAAEMTTAEVTASGWDECERVATSEPGVTTEAVRDARRFTLATMRQWDVTGRGDDIVLVVSELLTNAMRHAAGSRSRGAIRLGLIQPGPYVLCAVADPSELVPVPREPDYLAETGRGLHVISALSDRWGCTRPGAAGKVVWAMFRLCPGQA